MAEFSAVANLDIVPTGLGAARREIERELGDIEVGVSANRPTGGAVGSRGPESAGIDLNRRQLGQQERLVELAQERNDFLEELTEEGFGGGGGGGGFGLGFASRGILGGAVAGAGASAGLTGLLSAARLGGGAFSPGIFGRGGAGDPSELGPSGAVSEGIADLITKFTGIQQIDQGQQPGPGGAFETILGFFSDLNVPEGGTTDRRQGGADLSRPPPNIENRFNIDANVDVDTTTVNEQQIDQIVDRKTREMAEEIRRNLERSLGAGTDPRTAGNPAGPVGGPGSSGPTPF